MLIEKSIKNEGMTSLSCEQEISLQIFNVHRAVRVQLSAQCDWYAYTNML